MSSAPQQINLLNAALREQRDWLRLPMVAGLCVALVIGEAALYGFQHYQYLQLTATDSAHEQELKTLRDSVGALNKTLAERKPNAAMQQEVETAKAALVPRESVLGQLKTVMSEGVSENLRGLSRQTLNGVWLTEFAVRGQDLTLRGYLLDANLLPVYIARLNSETAFRGRHFASLNLKAVELQENKSGAEVKPAAPAVQAGRIEFALQSEAPPAPAAATPAGLQVPMPTVSAPKPQEKP